MSHPDRDYVRSRACKCERPAESCVQDDEVLTQHARRQGRFIDAPRVDQEVELSMLRGRWSVEDATRYRCSGRPPTQQDIDRAEVRYTTAGRLRAAGFAVIHTPSTRITNDAHVSVVWPPDDPLERQDVPWPEEVTEGFKSCFPGN